MMKPDKFLLTHELDHLLKLLIAPSQRSLRDPLMIGLLVKTGPRAQELLNLKVQDFNPSDPSIFICGIKGSYDRVIPISDDLSKRLSAYLRGKSPDEVMFPIKYNQLRNIWMFYRPVKKKLHALRHTFAIELYKKCKDIRLVQQALGHKDLANTMIYQDFQYTVDELRKALID